MAASEGFAHPEFLVDAAWAEAHLNDQDVVVSAAFFLVLV
jgi:hypothetical protein